MRQKTQLRIVQAHLDELIAHAREDLPNECCGVVAGKNGEATRVIRAVNAADSPLRYELDPRNLLQIFTELDNEELDLLAIYHSHTRSKAYPSQTDINLALYPDSLYVIVSLEDPESPDVRAFEIVERKVAEVPFELTDG